MTFYKRIERKGGAVMREEGKCRYSVKEDLKGKRSKCPDEDDWLGRNPRKKPRAPKLHTSSSLLVDLDPDPHDDRFTSIWLSILKHSRLINGF
jgi:hypothetical protein